MSRDRYNSTQHAAEAAPEPLHAFLVGTVHTARGPLVVSSLLGILITYSVYAMIGDKLFLIVFSLAHIVVGFARVRRLRIWRARCDRGLTARDVKDCDRDYLVWAATLSLLLGMTCVVLTAHADTPGAFALATSMCTGFAMSFATGNASRPWTMAALIAGLTAPQIIALLALKIPLGGVWTVLMLGLDGAALLVGRYARQRIVALFHADEANRVMAETDLLTGLKNRNAMTRVSAAALERVQTHPEESLAVYLIDLDRFKQVNDTLGHAAGDAVLIETAARLLAAAERNEVARMGGDEFMMLARLRGGDLEAEAIGQKVLARLSETYELAGAVLSLGGSIGVAIYPRHGQNIDELMIHADRALYEAKRTGRNRLRVFDDELETRLAEERLIANALERAFEQDELEVWHQPIHVLATGQIAGYEALVRWRHPTLGLIMPDRFIPLAEQSGAIVRLGEIVLAKACREATQWPAPLGVAVNVSPRQFTRPAALVAAVRRTLGETGLDPSRLFLEITESVMMEDAPATRAAVEEIAAMGVRFSLDDFGRGFSSLAYIQKYPFSKIKIDREFVRNIPADHVSCAIVASVCLLADRIGMSVVAEGVETETQRLALADLGVDLAQGYLFGRPERAPVVQPAFAPMRRSG